MENGFADQPQKVVSSFPELIHIRKTLCSIFKKIDLSDNIPESENQTSADQGRDQRGKDLAKRSHNLLHHILICLGRRLCRFLGDSFDACVGSELVVKYGHIISYNYLILPCLCECSFYCRNLFNGLLIRFLRIHEYETHSRHTMGNSLDVFFAADQL